MKDKDYIEELFSKTLNEHQVNVRPELWNSIQSQVATSGASTAASVASKSLWVKGFIGIGSVIAISIGTYVYFNPTEVIIEKAPQPIENTQPTKEIITSPKEEENITEIKGGNKLTTTTHENEENVNAFIQPSHQEVTETSAPPQVNLTPSNKEVVKKEPAVIEGPISIAQKATPKITTPEKLVQKEPATQNNNNNNNKAEPVHKDIIKPWDNTNVFTPNGDGVNDLFYLEIGELKEFSIAILDKDNNVVYISDSPQFKWDGTNYLTGEKVPDGTYSYILYAVDLTGEQTRQFNLLYITK